MDSSCITIVIIVDTLGSDDLKVVYIAENVEYSYATFLDKAKNQKSPDRTKL